MSENNFYLQEWFKTNFPVKMSDMKWHNRQKNMQKYSEQIKKNIKKLGDFEDVKLPDSKSLEKIYNESQKHWEQHKTFKGIPQKKLRELIFILFPNPIDGVKQGVYDNPEQFDDFLNILIKKNKQSVLRRLISELLYYYPEEKDLLFKRLEKLYSALEKNKKRNNLLITANKRFKIIEESGPKIIAQQILSKDKNIKDLLPKLWLKERHLSYGIGINIVRKICDLITPDIAQEKETTLDRFLEYLSGSEDIKPIIDASYSHSVQTGKIRYYNIKPVVQSLLLPFENKTPQALFKKKITQFLDKYIGDPRHKSEQWIDLPREKNIFQKWKVGETIEDFFALLDYTARQDPDSDRSGLTEKSL